MFEENYSGSLTSYKEPDSAVLWWEKRRLELGSEAEGVARRRGDGKGFLHQCVRAQVFRSGISGIRGLGRVW